MKKKKTIWRICIIAVSLLIGLAFTPWMIPKGVYEPMVLGIPYTLWTSFLITVILVALTFIGARVHPGSDEEEDES